MSSYFVQLTKILTSEGHVFDQERAFAYLGDVTKTGNGERGTGNGSLGTSVQR